MRQVLYRATTSPPWTGFGSFWAPYEHHARRYLRMPGFGGPVLYRAEVRFMSGPTDDFEEWMYLGTEAIAVDRAMVAEPGE